MISLRDDEPREFLEAVRPRIHRHVELSRRGVWHGTWAELREADAPRSALPTKALLHQRWHAARPILLRGWVEPEHFREELADRRRLFHELAEPGGLRDFLRSRREEFEPHFTLAARPARLADPERDIERHALTWRARPDDPASPVLRDLWVKSAWLSTSGEERSLRLCVSAGREGPDDASRDLRTHRRVAELAGALLPESLLASEHELLIGLLEDFLAGPVLLSQHIAYWNAPEGGALFHHDAFDEHLLGGQRGVVFLQLDGVTAWLALSIDDLGRRVTEFAEYLKEGELAWVRRALFGRSGSFTRFHRLTQDPQRLRRELARPGCGSLGPVVGRGPEFTALLADAGHALVLEPGDILVLPNHGLARTCMHSVFCATDTPAYGVSMALRELEPAPDPDGPPPDSTGRGHGTRRSRARRPRRGSRRRGERP